MLFRSQPHPAGNALAAGLCGAELQKAAGEIQRTEPRRARDDPAFEVLVEGLDRRLSLVARDDAETTQNDHSLTFGVAELWNGFLPSARREIPVESV